MRLSGGQAAERGAEYLHGARVATWEYVARFGLATHLASGPTRIGVPEFRRGEWWPAGASDSDRALQGLGAALAIPDAADVSLRDALNRAGFSGDRLRAAEGRMEVLSPIDPTVVSARSAAAAWRLVAPETACFVLVGGYGQLWDKLSRPFADRILLSSPVAALDWSPAGVTAHVAAERSRAGPPSSRCRSASSSPGRWPFDRTSRIGSGRPSTACGAAPSSR